MKNPNRTPLLKVNENIHDIYSVIRQTDKSKLYHFTKYLMTAYVKTNTAGQFHEFH